MLVTLVEQPDAKPALRLVECLRWDGWIVLSQGDDVGNVHVSVQQNQICVEQSLQCILFSIAVAVGRDTRSSFCDLCPADKICVGIRTSKCSCHADADCRDDALGVKSGSSDTSSIHMSDSLSQNELLVRDAMPSAGVTLWTAISQPNMDPKEAAQLIKHGYRLGSAPRGDTLIKYALPNHETEV